LYLRARRTRPTARTAPPAASGRSGSSLRFIRAADGLIRPSIRCSADQNVSSLEHVVPGSVKIVEQRVLKASRQHTRASGAVACDVPARPYGYGLSLGQSDVTEPNGSRAESTVYCTCRGGYMCVSSVCVYGISPCLWTVGAVPSDELSVKNRSSSGGRFFLLCGNRVTWCS
jgi:hypothetical protein